MSAIPPPVLSSALKEWAVVCRAVGEGRQDVLLRKGGIVERGDGFALESPWFWLLPTLEHQNAADVRESPEGAPGGPPEGPFPVSLLARGEARPINTLEEGLSLLPRTIHTEAFLRKRWAYRPDRPLFAVTLTIFRLPAPVVVPADPRYAGCVSWTELAAPITTAGARPL
jgi:hypothetical protein